MNIFLFAAVINFVLRMLQRTVLSFPSGARLNSLYVLNSLICTIVCMLFFYCFYVVLLCAYSINNKIIRIDFEVMLKFACSLGLLVITLSSLKLHSENNACTFILLTGSVTHSNFVGDSI